MYTEVNVSLILSDHVSTVSIELGMESEPDFKK